MCKAAAIVLALAANNVQCVVSGSPVLYVSLTGDVQRCDCCAWNDRRNISTFLIQPVTRPNVRDRCKQ